MKTSEQVKLAYDVLAFIQEHPEHHDQDFWVNVNPSAYPVSGSAVASGCGTTACFAGWTALLAGAVFTDPWMVRTLEGLDVRADLFAAEKLGLTDYEQNWLFLRCQDEADLKSEIERFFGPYRRQP